MLDYIDQFTHIINFLIIIVYLLFIFGNKKMKVFANNIFLTRVVSYITLVMIIAWFSLTPIIAFGNYGSNDSSAIVRTLNDHTICPIIFIIFYILHCRYNTNIQYQNIRLLRNILLALILPSAYFVCLFAINFIPLSNRVFNTSQNFVFNFNPNIKHYVCIYPEISNFNTHSYLPIFDEGKIWWNDDIVPLPNSLKESDFVHGNFYNLIQVVAIIWSFIIFYILFLFINLWLTKSKLVALRRK